MNAPRAVLADEALEKLLRYARAECDILILDTPAVLMSGDAIPLIRRADGVLLIARHREDVDRGRGTSERDAGARRVLP